ncbi:superoxide dismutase family protein [Rubrobacter indicoceani]|uniref:superoxide dismutase family protein n=1 Tax=Rubrobacter indicoceani TaxID=2051957 RepID=UPI0013C510DD|nr:superoxide dismutase family protein [Rubrobacter indicoceani]
MNSLTNGRTKSAALFGAALAGVLVIGTPANAQDGQTATAELRTGEGEPVGTAQFVETPGGVEITVNVTGNVAPGERGMHIHESGDLSDPAFESAGDHFNPTDAEHGFDNSNGPHAGDLDNIIVAEDGTASYSYLNDRITLSGGENAILDSDGSSLIIHDMPDDYTTDDDPETGPGMSGDRVAAGEIEGSESLPDTGGPALLVPAGAALAALGAGALLFVRRLRARA